jgi:DNA recombination protein RmuC
MTTVEIVMLILLIGLMAVVIWNIAEHRRATKKQGEDLTKVVGERLDSATNVFGDVQRGLGELSIATKQVYEVGKDISSLQELLRPPKLRGQLGELFLERILAQALPSTHYELQHRFRSGETVDAVIHIGEKLVPVDSKFPLEDFERVFKAESEEEQKIHRREFVRTIKRHIDDVAKYILPDEDTFDFALMYIPAENIYYETIIKEEGDLYPYALEKKVIPVSPNTFYAYLQVIVFGLKGMRIEEKAREIIAYLGRLQGDFGQFQDDFETLGKHLSNAKKKYDDAERRLEKFSEKLQKVGEITAKELPEAEKEGTQKELFL